jgi:hypothetical protein
MGSSRTAAAASVTGAYLSRRGEHLMSKEDGFGTHKKTAGGKKKKTSKKR